MYLAFPLVVLIDDPEDRLWRGRPVRAVRDAVVGPAAAGPAVVVRVGVVPVVRSSSSAAGAVADFAVGIVVARLCWPAGSRLRFRTVLLLILAGWAAGLAIPVPFGFIALFIVPMARCSAPAPAPTWPAATR
jgi:hypothetical protein